MEPIQEKASTGIQTILVIDDDPFFRGYLCELLSGRGYSIYQAENGEVGLDSFRENNPDLVLTDIIMPQKEGLEFIKDLKKEAPNARIIAMTGGGNYGLCHNYMQLANVLGAVETLIKPFKPKVLLDAIRKVESGAQYQAEDDGNN